MSSSPLRSVKRPPAETRNLMLQTISELLETRAPWDIRASEVAAAAGTTQPNFYSHFRNIEDAITARAQQVWALYPTARLAELLEQGLRGGDDESIRSFFALTIEFWSRHAGLLRAVSRLPGDEHPAIRDIRHAAQDPILHLCQAAIIEGQACDALAAEWHPWLGANAALRFLDEAACHYKAMRDTGEFTHDDILITIAGMFRRLLSGR